MVTGLPIDLCARMIKYKHDPEYAQAYKEFTEAVDKARIEGRPSTFVEGVVRNTV